MSTKPKLSFWAILGPGLLLAATGIGGGDLTTATFVGGMLGTSVLWAVALGAFMKFVITEGLTRWQLATGETLLEGVAKRVGRVAIWIFLPYFLLWSFFVASAQMSANGVALHALIPLFDDATDGKIAFGVLASLVGAHARAARRLPLVRSGDEDRHRRDVRDDRADGHRVVARRR